MTNTNQNTDYEEFFTFCMECDELLNPGKDNINCDRCCKWAHAACVRIPTEAMESFHSIKKFGFLWMCNECQPSRGDTTSLPSLQNKGCEEIMQADKVVVEMEEFEAENDGKSVEKVNKEMSIPFITVKKVVIPEKTDGEQVSEQLPSNLSNWPRVKKKRIRKPVTCPQCGKTFKSHSALQYHIPTAHTGEKPFSCAVCDKKFPLKNSLLIHVKIHSEEKTYCCNICDSRFTLPSSLNSHLKTHNKPFWCTWEGCDRKFAQKEQLKAHIQRHTGAPPPFMCHVCGQAFYSSRTLRKHHVKIHTNDVKSFSCSTCNKKFSFQSDLNTHVRNKHVATKPLCNICGVSCADNSCLRTHLLTHSEEKPFACEFCEKRFILNGPLQEHRRVHTGEKPFSCKVCFKRFSQRHSLKSHLKNLHSADSSEVLLV